MSTKKKFLVALALVGCAILLVVGSVAGTMAYLTSTTGSVTNTFAVGKVIITLDESKLKDDGFTVDTNTKVQANTYHLFPGLTYEKDPTVHLDSTSESCWLFVKVKNEISDIEVDAANGDTIAEQIAGNGWKVLGKTTDGCTVYYYETIATTSKVDYKVFSTFTIASTVDNDTLATYQGKTIELVAYAVQSAGFTTAEAAWDSAFNGTIPVTPAT